MTNEKETPKQNWTLADQLVFDWMMVYTSPSWGGDERTPEGAKQKETALKRSFESTIRAYEKHFNVALLDPLPADLRVMPKIAEVDLAKCDELGDTFINFKKDSPTDQWIMIQTMLQKAGYKVIKEQ